MQCTSNDTFVINLADTFLNVVAQILNEGDADEDSDDVKSWMVPKPGAKAEEGSSPQNETDNSSLRPIPDECVICMNQYTAGDRIIWSSNPGCIHCFHSECLRAWLLPFEPRNQLCPCCRQSYCQEKAKLA